MRHLDTFGSLKTALGSRVAGWAAFESWATTGRLGRMDLIEGDYQQVSVAARDLGVSPYDLSLALMSGDLVDLDDHMWSRLENSDSYEVRDMEDFRALSGGYGKDYRMIASAKDPSVLPPALVVEYMPGRYRLVSGNTRLMWMRANGHTPKVVVGRLKK
jgi:hypothetical protein